MPEKISPTGKGYQQVKISTKSTYRVHYKLVNVLPYWC